MDVDDIICTVFEYLPWFDIIQSGAVSFRWRYFALSDYLWEQLCIDRWGQLATTITTIQIENNTPDFDAEHRIYRKYKLFKSLYSKTAYPHRTEWNYIGIEQDKAGSVLYAFRLHIAAGVKGVNGHSTDPPSATTDVQLTATTETNKEQDTDTGEEHTFPMSVVYSPIRTRCDDKALEEYLDGRCGDLATEFATMRIAKWDPFTIVGHGDHATDYTLIGVTGLYRLSLRNNGLSVVLEEFNGNVKCDSFAGPAMLGALCDECIENPIDLAVWLWDRNRFPKDKMTPAEVRFLHHIEEDLKAHKEEMPD
eukprot:TRINITY_DN62628_c0_g1_i2.p1 TRINITY_DN62628_c0_g1~~TRINITY_DN62628_c0_g1_i2.p1  ORF type:complete len:308 (-),score=34.76 TRINITY_DN62628_c0_g1_i2:4-927(-)